MIDQIRKQLIKVLGYPDKSVRIVDSIPIPVCKFGRAPFHKSFEVNADYGFVLPKKKPIMDLNYMFSLQLMVMLQLSSLLQPILMTEKLYGSWLKPRSI